MKTYLFLISLLLFGNLSNNRQIPNNNKSPKEISRKVLEKLNKITFDHIIFENNTLRLSDYLQKKTIMIVSTASNDGYTPQYEPIQKLHEDYNETLIIIALPCNDFMWQEPGTSQEIYDFIQTNYGGTFFIGKKIKIKKKYKDKDMHSFYKILYNNFGFKPGWNFYKYIITTDLKIYEFPPGLHNSLDNQIIEIIKKDKDKRLRL